ncbi:UCH-domain-containing protein [Rhypophila decipiens]|uniref:UCH-domain-containing protein n=1 Tax=Rhypophila decipiens TaxID=261697 RepID=A0AAN6YFC3_9PEZI|nr:UCH-domain-containing protein [Rhypophila decipiens]
MPMRETIPRSVEVELVTDQLEIPSLDDRTYRVIRLPNQLEVLLVHDPQTDKASASMDVNVGSFSDEDDMPGMAHAVEHLLFMGTKKYPVENDYGQYLQAHSGSSNAYTSTTSTNYHFEVSAKPSNDEEPSATNPSPLLGALDRFAQFFVEPLFLESTLDRELRAVDSENKKNLQSDTWRLHQLDKSLSNPKHPYCHFSTGNVETLKTIPEARGLNIRDKFIEFYQKHYSANRMKLCVLGREPLDALEAWVSEFFSVIKNQDLTPNRWPHQVPFTQEQLGTICWAKPVMDSRELSLSFPFLDEELLFETQPSRYLSHLIGHEGPGSIMAYIKSKGWANGLSAGAYPVCAGTPGLFECQIRLTPEGLKNYKEIVKVFFQYVALLGDTEPQQWIFEEQKGMADVDFRFKQKTQSYRFTSKISSVMQRPIPREWLLSGHSKLRKFDAKLIKDGLACLRPDNFKLTIVSRDLPGKWENKEKWYGTEYTLEKIPSDFLDDIKKAATMPAKDRVSKLHLPHKNQFIPTKLEVEKKDVKEPALAPKIVRNDQLVRTWYKKDDTFWVPKANLVVSCKSPIIYATAENSVKARIFTDLVRDALEEYSYDAELAGLQYSVSLDSRGLFIEVSGYNDKLPVLLEQVLITMRDLEVRSDRFAIIKERLSRAYRNWELQPPWQQIGDYTSWLTCEHDFVVEELSAELPDITAEAVGQFRKELLAQMHMELYVHGNFYKEDALKLTDMIESTLKPRVLPRQQWPIQRSLIFPPGSNYVWKKTLKDAANVNHCIEYWLYIGDKADYQIRAKTLLIDQILHEPCFDQLRTKEQLGYIVFSGVRPSTTTYGFRFIIQSEKTAPYLETRIELFLESMLKTLESMSDKDFENNKRSLIVKRLEKPKHLDQETGKHWNQIHSEYYNFESAQQDVAHIKPLTKTDMIEFFNEYLHPKSPSRAKLAVYFVAQAKSDVSTQQISEVIAKLGLDSTGSAKAATDLQARLSAADHDEEKEIKGLKEYLLHDLKVTEDKIDAAADAWRKLHTQNSQASDIVKDAEPPSANGTVPHIIDDVRTFKAGLAATAGARKRRITRQSAREQNLSLERSSNTSLDQVVPSTETDDAADPDPDPASFSFSAASTVSGLSTPTYVRGNSLAASGVPSRLQTSQTSFCSTTDCPSSAASSPLAASTDLSLDTDRAADLFEFPTSAHSHSDYSGAARGPSPLINTPHRALMGGAADFPQRSSSPLKRRASSMDPETENIEAPKDDVDMVAPPATGEMDGQIPGTDGTTELPLRTGKHHGTPNRDSSVLTGIADLPPLEHQIKTIQTLVKAFEERPEQEGDQAYLVSRKWLNKALDLGSDSKHGAKDKSVEQLGPIDNSDIISAIFTDAIGQHCVKLKPGMGTENFELFPKDAWDLIVSWYGLAPGQTPIVRTAHDTAPDPDSAPNVQFEFHPPVFTIHRIWSANSPIPLEQKLKQEAPAPPIVVQSTLSVFHDFLKQAKLLTGVPTERKVRLWRRLQTISATETPSVASGINTPPDSPDNLGASSDMHTGLPPSPGAWAEMLVEVDSFLKLEQDVERGLVDAEDTTVNPKYNGHKTLALVGLTVDSTLLIDEQVDKSAFVTTYVPAKDKSLATLPAQTRASASGRSSPALSGPVTRGRAQQKSGRTVGCVGLQNLGNTCYMNSALQCVRSVEELTKYFLTREAHNEINRENPLGNKGEVALAYGKLLEEIYKEPVPNSVAPRSFKNTIGRHQPAFSGYGQQDSQEFIGFLLDGLQEDLNRIKKKPYIEKPDSTDEMLNNPELIREMANKVWDITKKRDDSVIADLFTGMYKSTLVCPDCDKVSITFDPFNNLTLPLPVTTPWYHTVKFLPLNDVPVHIAVELDSRNGTIKSLKEYISARVGVPVNRLVGAEEFRERFFKYYDDGKLASDEIQTGDVPTIHEVEAPPTNVGGVKKTKDHNNQREDGMADRLLVPVSHRINPEDPSGPRNRFRGSKADVPLPPPHFIVLTPDEAQDEEIIRRKVLEKVLTFTTWSQLHSANETDTAESTDPEMVNTTSDVDSADSKEHTNSIPAEESPLLLKRFNTRRPKWIDPMEYLGVENLFELSYFRESNPSSNGQPTMPVGWNNVSEDALYPRLRTRLPSPPQSDLEMQSPGAWPTGSDESGSDEVPSVDARVVTRMADESSEEETDLPQVKNKKPLNPQKTYSKKARKRLEKQQRQRASQSQQQQNHLQPNRSYDMPPASDDADGGPLLRLGEGLVVDWFHTAFEEVFGGKSLTDRQGMRTYADLQELEDPAIARGKKLRELRSKNGIHLDDCLNEFEKTETLSEQDMWYCPRCKEHRRASKKFDLWKTPDILVVHLKRFSSSGYRREKLDILVDFPIEGLDLTRRVLDREQGKEEIYDLIAVDNHWGGLGGGHYTAFAKNFFDEEWYEYNDSNVTKTKNPGSVISTGAYLLFYRRRSAVPLGGPKFQEIFERFEQGRSAPVEDDTTWESGEGQRLGQGSSLRGSPSASTGAGLIRPLGSRGLASSNGGFAASSGSVLLLPSAATDDEVDMLPSYQASTSGQDGGALDEDAPEVHELLWTDPATLHNSIEADAEDEGIGMTDYDVPDSRTVAGMTGVFSSSWNFDNIKRHGSAVDDDGASNIAEQDDSSNNADYASDQEMGDGMMILAPHGPHRLGEEPGSNYVEPDEPLLPLIEEDDGFGAFETTSGLPPLDEPSHPQPDYISQLTAQSLRDHLENPAHQQVHTVPAHSGDEDADSDKVAEIHVGEEEELNGRHSL